MTTTTILKSCAAVLLLLSLSACSGGGQEPIEPLAVNEPTTPDQPAPPAPPPTTTPPPPTTPPPATNPPSVPRNPPPSAPPAPPTTPAPSPTGVWKGFVPGTGEATLAIVEPNNRAWFLVAAFQRFQEARTIVRGTLVTNGTTWTMNSALVTNVDSQRKGTLRGSGTWLDNQRLAGTFTLTAIDPLNGGDTDAPNGAELVYDIRSENPLSLSQVAGQYIGVVALLERRTTITLNANGSITGEDRDGCTFSGQATPNAGGSASLTLTFRSPLEGPPCLAGDSTVQGVLWADAAAHQLFMAGTNAAQDAFWVFMGE